MGWSRNLIKKRHIVRIAVAAITFSLGATSVWIYLNRPRFHRGNSANLTWSTPELKRPTSEVLSKLADLPEPMREGCGASVQFVNESDGWLSVCGGLWRTADGGKTWTSIEFPRADGRPVYDPSLSKFQLISARTGWLISDYQLYYTVDSGANWKLIKQPIKPFKSEYGHHGVEDLALSPDGLQGWILGARLRPLQRGEFYNQWNHAAYSENEKQIATTVIYHTTDGGKNWFHQPIDTSPYFAHEIVAGSAGQALVFGMSGVFYLHGSRWLPVNENADDNYSSSNCIRAWTGGPSASPVSATFANSKVGWLMSSLGYVGKTVDGGRTWTDISGELSEGFLGDNMFGEKVQFLNPCGFWALDGRGKLRRSRDFGLSWEVVDKSHTYSDFFVLDKDHGWAVSRYGIFSFPKDSTPDYQP